MTIPLLVAAALVAACVVFVAEPYLREPDPASDTLESLDRRQAHRMELAEERDRALMALRELEDDHRAGRMSDADYRAQVGTLRREAAQALRALDAVAPLDRERED